MDGVTALWWPESIHSAGTIHTATYPQSAVPAPATPTESRGLCYAPQMPQTVSTDTPEIAALRVKANAGDAGAQYSLGVMYAEGQGVPQDRVSAYMWLTLSIARGTVANQKRAAAFRDLFTYTMMTPAQIASGQRLARAWLAAFEKRGGK